MITLFTQLIQDHPEWLVSKNKKTTLSFMKLSTPTSGTRSDDGKVLIFVFEDQQKIPTLCIKTTRTYEAGYVIRRNYENLKKLTEKTARTTSKECADLFARPLYLHDDGALIFCIESMCVGEKFSAQNQNFELVIEKYRTWQMALAQKNTQNSSEIRDAQSIRKLALDTAQSLGLAPLEVAPLMDYFHSKQLNSDTKLPILIQHGDMTPDNVLVSRGAIYLVDYDYAHISTLPGYDLFHFLSKSKVFGTFRSNCDHYFPLYFKSIGANVPSFEAILFLYHLQESFRKGCAGKTGKEIIADFESLLKRS